MLDFMTEIYSTSYHVHAPVLVDNHTIILLICKKQWEDQHNISPQWRE